MVPGRISGGSGAAGSTSTGIPSGPCPAGLFFSAAVHAGDRTSYQEGSASTNGTGAHVAVSRQRISPWTSNGTTIPDGEMKQGLEPGFQINVNPPTMHLRPIVKTARELSMMYGATEIPRASTDKSTQSDVGAGPLAVLKTILRSACRNRSRRPQTSDLPTRSCPQPVSINQRWMVLPSPDPRATAAPNNIPPLSTSTGASG